MGDANQLAFLKQHVPTVDGPVLEVGSKQYGSTSSFRDFYRGVEYVGIDMEAGEGVDRVIDLSIPLPKAEVLADCGVALVVCCSVLEHVERPWVMAENITMLMRHGGKLYISVPWVWRWHGYPSDYWRFSWRGIEVLFPDFTWEKPVYSGNVPGEFTDAEPGADDKMAVHVGERKYLPYLMVNMIGTRK